MAAGHGRTMLFGGIALGVVLGAAVALLLPIVTLGDDTESPIRLRPEGSNGACMVTAKEQVIRGKRNHKVVWEIANHCPSAQTVTLGNFRTAAGQGPDNCDAATSGGATWPFKGSDTINHRQATINAGGTYNPKTGKIQLTIDPNLPGDVVEYIYDVCLGGSKADPVLIIER